MNHEYRMKFLNESRIIEVKQDRNHEYPKSNDSASTPDLILYILKVTLLPKRLQSNALSRNFFKFSAPKTACYRQANRQCDRVERCLLALIFCCC